VVKDFADIVASEALTLHLLVIVHLTFCHFAVVKLVPLRRFVCRSANTTSHKYQSVDRPYQLAPSRSRRQNARLLTEQTNNVMHVPKTQTAGQTDFTKAASDPPRLASSILRNLHHMLDLNPSSRICTVKPHNTQTDRQTRCQDHRRQQSASCAA